MSTSGRPRVGSRTVRTAFRVYRGHPAQIGGIAALVFAPLALVSSLAAAEVDWFSGGGTSRAVLAGVVLLVTALFTAGAAVAAGLMDGITATEFGAEPVPMRIAWRRLPKARLVKLDVSLALVVSVTMLLGGFPGVIAFTLLCVAAPLLVHDDLGVRAAMTRSFQVTRHHFFVTFAIVTLPVLIEHQLLDALELVWDFPFLLALALTLAHDAATEIPEPTGEESSDVHAQPVSP